MNREEHLQRCKERAMEYIKRDDYINAWVCFSSDMEKHEETKNHPALPIGIRMLAAGQICSVSAMERLIKGFN